MSETNNNDDVNEIVKSLVAKRDKKKKSTLGTNAIQTAQLILENSYSSDFMPEIDKEIKLSNLDAFEKFGIYEMNSVWIDIQWLKQQQEKKKQEAILRYGERFIQDYDNVTDDIENMYDEFLEKNSLSMPIEFDQLGLYRKARFVAVLSRGKGGFERTKQVETIQQQKIEQNDLSEKKPGFISSMMGRFRR